MNGSDELDRASLIRIDPCSGLALIPKIERVFLALNPKHPYKILQDLAVLSSFVRPLVASGVLPRRRPAERRDRLSQYPVLKVLRTDGIRALWCAALSFGASEYITLL